MEGDVVVKDGTASRKETKDNGMNRPRKRNVPKKNKRKNIYDNLSHLFVKLMKGYAEEDDW